MNKTNEEIQEAQLRIWSKWQSFRILFVLRGSFLSSAHCSLNLQEQKKEVVQSMQQKEGKLFKGTWTR